MRLLIVGVILGWIFHSPSIDYEQSSAAPFVQQQVKELKTMMSELKKTRPALIPVPVHQVSHVQADKAVVKQTQKTAIRASKPECRRRPPDALGNIDYWSCL